MELVSTTNGHVADSFSIQRESGFLYILFRHGGQLNYLNISHATKFPVGSAAAWQCWDASSSYDLTTLMNFLESATCFCFTYFKCFGIQF